MQAIKPCAFDRSIGKTFFNICTRSLTATERPATDLVLCQSQTRLLSTLHLARARIRQPRRREFATLLPGCGGGSGPPELH